jgi:YidC/Oxa1 family membrane protein insertase
MLDPIFNGLADLLAFFYELVPSYGIAIVLFTLTIMAFTTPFSMKSTRSMIRMQRLQPELKRLQEQYKGDREALNREMMAFYQANNVNPLASCLPMLLQMPVFIVLFRILRGLTGTKSPEGFFRPHYIKHDSALYQALSHAKRMMSFGVDLSQSVQQELSKRGLGPALPLFVLVALVVLTQWYQQRQIQGRNPTAVTNPQQQMITKVLPFITLPIAIALPAGVVIYMLVSNMVRVVQQAAITRLEYGPNAPPVDVVKPPPAPKPAPSSNGKAKTPPPKAPPSAAGGRVTASGSAQQRRRKRK